MRMGWPLSWNLSDQKGEINTSLPLEAKPWAEVAASMKF